MNRKSAFSQHARTSTSSGRSSYAKLIRGGCLTVLIALLLTTPAHRAATPGLPLVEDFSDASLRDGAGTFADWSTAEQALLLPRGGRGFMAFGPGTLGLGITSGSWDTRAVALGDVDGDGDIDLVAGNYTGQVNRLYLNNGSADPWNGVTGFDITTDVGLTAAVALADVDGDGDLDLVVGNAGNQPNRLYLSQCSGTSLCDGATSPWNGVAGVDITADEQNTQRMALGDVDGDGDLDLVAGNGGQANRLYVNQCAGTGLCDGATSPWLGVSGVDITADGDLDVAASSVKLGDVDADGDLDLVVGNSSNQPNRLYLNNGTAMPWNGVAGVNITSDADFTTEIALGDVDGDGDLDLVAGNYAQPGRLYLNQCSDTSLCDGATSPWNGVAGVDITTDDISNLAVALGDVDGDGDLDLVAVNSDLQRNRLYLNNGTAEPWNGVAGFDITNDRDATYAAVLSDVDGDGALDLVTGNFGISRLYLNTGRWDAAGGTDIDVSGNATASLALGDLDLDGDLDVIVGNDGRLNVLYVNNGTADPWNGVTGIDLPSTLINTRAVALGDMDGDGDLDLVVGNFLQRAQYYQNRLDGDSLAFSQPSDISPDTDGTFALALGDVDGDGDLDLVTIGRNRLYLNNGTASPFSGVTPFLIDNVTGSSAGALGDVDGDGDLDLVIRIATWNKLYLNNGTAAPWSGVTGVQIALDYEETRSLALADVDRDGDLDLVAGNYAQPNRLYLNNGTTDPWNGVAGVDITADADDTRSVALVDMDGDGDLDLVAGNDGQPNRLYLNNGTADPWQGVVGFDITADADDTRSVALGDVDEDGDLDVLAGNSFYPSVVYLNPQSATPWSAATAVDITDDIDITYSVALGDVDADGDLDLVAGNNGTPDRLYLNNGSAAPWNGVTAIDITSDTTRTDSVVLGDVDRDGDLDLVKSGAPGRLYLNNGTADPWSGTTGTDISPDALQFVALGDLDGDGDLDLVSGRAANQTNRLYLNNGTASPWPGVAGVDITADADATVAVALGDVDLDGDLDLVVANIGSQTNRYYRNQCSETGLCNGVSTNPWSGVAGVDITADANSTSSMVLGDVDGDGDLDLVTGNQNQPNRLYLNVCHIVNSTGGCEVGTFPYSGFAYDITADDDYTKGVTLADVDGDGDLDLVVGNQNQPNRLYLNQCSDTGLCNGVSTDPWQSVVGTDITADADYTSSVAVADVNRDGILDVVAGNLDPANRLYLGSRYGYNTAHGRATSVRVDTEVGTITNATLTAISTQPPNTAIDYFLSNDGGGRWHPVDPGQQFIFPSAGLDLRWRSELQSLSPALSPSLELLEVTTQNIPALIGDRVWADVDGDGLQDPGEPGIDSVVVILYEGGGGIVDIAVSDANGDYSFTTPNWYGDYYLRYFPPTGYALAPQDQGANDALDSDPDPASGLTPIFNMVIFQSDEARWDAGMVPVVACTPPDEPIYLYDVTMSTDGNNYPILNFQDANQPLQITGYNIYRASAAALTADPSSLFASDVIDMDEATPNKQWVDSSDDVSPSGIWYFQVSAYNDRCPAQTAEGPF